MGLRTDINRGFSCWSPDSQKVSGDPLRKVVCFSAGAGGNEQHTYQEQSGGEFTGITAAEMWFALQISVKLCSSERHLS